LATIDAIPEFISKGRGLNAQLVSRMVESIYCDALEGVSRRNLSPKALRIDAIANATQGGIRLPGAVSQYVTYFGMAFPAEVTIQ
jgi:hypothetical protein